MRLSLVLASVMALFLPGRLGGAPRPEPPRLIPACASPHGVVFAHGAALDRPANRRRRRAR